MNEGDSINREPGFKSSLRLLKYLPQITATTKPPIRINTASVRAEIRIGYLIIEIYRSILIGVDSVCDTYLYVSFERRERLHD
jgi:hypothetical protein